MDSSQTRSAREVAGVLLMTCAPHDVESCITSSIVIWNGFSGGKVAVGLTQDPDESA